MTATVLWHWPGGDDIAARAGQCYTLAMETVLANAALALAGRLWLVHGLLHADRSTLGPDLASRPEGCPPPNPHAWLELTADDGEAGLDPVLRMWAPLDEFRATFGCETIRRYRGDVALDVSARNDHYGPWDRRSCELWEQRQEQARQNPTWSTEQTVARYFAKGGT